MIDRLTEWIHSLVVDILYSLFGSLIYNIDATTAFDIDGGSAGAAGHLAQSPMDWLGGAPGGVVQTLAETVIPPIAGIVLAYIMCWEVIQMMVDHNQDELEFKQIGTFIVKLVFAVFLATNAFPIAMGMFDVAGWLVMQAAAQVVDVVSLSPGEIRAVLEEATLPALFSLLPSMGAAFLGAQIMPIIVSIIVWGRTIEILIAASAAPIPLATLMQRDMSPVGQNYLKYLAALGFQGFLIVVCLAIYSAVVMSVFPAPGTILTLGDINSWVWSVLAVTVLLCFALFKTAAISKSIFSAH